MTIEAIDLDYQIGSKQILSKIELEIKPGELHVLIGRNGAGKSTLFHALCGDLVLKNGNIYLDGIDLKNYPKSELAKKEQSLPKKRQLLFPLPQKKSSNLDDTLMKKTQKETKKLFKLV